MVASGFGAPLVKGGGRVEGYLMGVSSPASGIGKSTALMEARPYGPSQVVGGLSDTVIFTFDKQRPCAISLCSMTRLRASASLRR